MGLVGFEEREGLDVHGPARCQRELSYSCFYGSTEVLSRISAPLSQEGANNSLEIKTPVKLA